MLQSSVLILQLLFLHLQLLVYFVSFRGTRLEICQLRLQLTILAFDQAALLGNLLHLIETDAETVPQQHHCYCPLLSVHVQPAQLLRDESDITFHDALLVAVCLGLCRKHVAQLHVAVQEVKQLEMGLGRVLVDHLLRRREYLHSNCGAKLRLIPAVIFFIPINESENDIAKQAAPATDRCANQNRLSVQTHWAETASDAS